MKRLLSIVAALWLSLQPVAGFAALPNEDILDMFDKNGIYYYNPAGSNNQCNQSSTTLAGNDNAEKVWNYFTSNGFTDAQAAGILGNAKIESGVLPTRASNNSFWGLFQWGGGRKDKLFEQIRAAGLEQYLSQDYWGANVSIPEADNDKLLEIELDFALSETTMDWQNEIKKVNKPEVAAEVFLTLFERAVGGKSEVLYYAPYAGQFYQATKARRDAAKDYYSNYAGKGIATGLSNTEDGTNMVIIGDSITEASRTALKEKFPKLTDTQINAEIGRPWKSGIDLLDQATGSIIVYALGTNNEDGLTTSQIEAVLAKLKKSQTIVFVTNYGTADYSTNNDLFKTYAKQNSNIIIADWAETVAQNTELYLASDKVHPTTSGQNLFAETLYQAINSNTNDAGCSVSGEFQSLVLAYAWPQYHRAPWHDRMPAYADAVTQSISEGRYVGGSVAGVPGIDCGGFVTILVQNSGLEPNYNDTKGTTSTQEAWVKSHNWQLLNTSPTTSIDTSILQPGDVAFSSGHTFIYVGEIPGFDSVIASASFSTHGAGRAPMAGAEDLIFGNGVTVRWYRNPNFNPYETTTTGTNAVSGLVSNGAPSSAQLLNQHHITFYTGLASENGGNAGRNASSKYNNGYLAPGQAASSNLPLGTVVYVQTQASGEASYANGKYFLITDRGAGKINGDYNLDIYHDAPKASDNNKAPYGSSSSAKIYKVAEGVSWETFKAKYGW